MAQFMDVVSLTKGIRFMFYIITPNESPFENVEDVAPYVQQVSSLLKTLERFDVFCDFLTINIVALMLGVTHLKCLNMAKESLHT